MYHDWIYWLSSKTAVELGLLLLPLLCLDCPRYTLSSLVMCLWDECHGWLRDESSEDLDSTSSYVPSVCVVLAGLNESETIGATLASTYESYPNLEIIVVDDGSSDRMVDIAIEFASSRDGILVLRKPERGGKSSALNFALPFTKAEIIIAVDTDSTLAAGAIWDLIRPFRDPRVGATGGAVIARNGHHNLVTLLQAGEYLRTIFLGRMLPSRLGILNIVSGAFGAFRREAILGAKGWDVGPGEDGDLIFRLRKSGWKIVHVPYAQCFTNVPQTWLQLYNQRRRWDWSIITFDCRKHADMADLRSSNFRWSNFVMLIESWFFRVFMSIVFVFYLAWLVLLSSSEVGYVLLTNYVVYLLLDAVQWVVLFYYSVHRRRDLAYLPGILLSPAYSFFLRVTTIVAMAEETLWRQSWKDGYVPERVRRVTWHW
jgi:biofilm PGA synthesis N-glycosyltransferase PgaC